MTPRGLFAYEILRNRNMKKHKIYLAALVCLLLVSNCGGGSGPNFDAGNSGVDKESVVKIAAESLETETGFYSEEYAECLLEGLLEITPDLSWEDIGEALERDGNLESLQSSEQAPDEEELLSLAFTCMGEGDVLEDLMDDVAEDGTSSDGNSVGGNYGDDPYLDNLYDQCADGDDQACDDLFWESPLNSEYEAFGENCGGRGCY